MRKKYGFYKSSLFIDKSWDTVLDWVETDRDKVFSVAPQLLYDIASIILAL